VFANKIGLFLIKHNIIISFSGAVLSYGVSKKASLHEPMIYALITGLLSFSVYTLHRLIDKTLPQIDKKQLVVLGFVLISLLCVAYMIRHYCTLHVSVFLISLFFCLLCVWYVVPLFLHKKLREITGVKILVIALTWSYSCVGFPLLNAQFSMYYIMQFFILVALYFVAITLPFDIRDMHTDISVQSTIPQLIGQKRARIFGLLLLLIVYLSHFILNISEWNNLFFHGAIGVQMVLVAITNKRSSNVHFGLIDLSIALLGISYFI